MLDTPARRSEGVRLGGKEYEPQDPPPDNDDTIDWLREAAAALPAAAATGGNDEDDDSSQDASYCESERGDENEESEKTTAEEADDREERHVHVNLSEIQMPAWENVVYGRPTPPQMDTHLCAKWAGEFIWKSK